MNPLNKFNFNGTQNQTPQGNGNMNWMQMAGQFMNFAKNFQGNPEDTVKQMIKNGQITEEQIQQIMPMAEQTQKILNQFGIKF